MTDTFNARCSVSQVPILNSDEIPAPQIQPIPPTQKLAFKTEKSIFFFPARKGSGRKGGDKARRGKGIVLVRTAGGPPVQQHDPTY
jgi:hypothetical protein